MKPAPAVGPYHQISRRSQLHVQDMTAAWAIALACETKNPPDSFAGELLRAVAADEKDLREVLTRKYPAKMVARFEAIILGT